jgi:hypothetical protein
MTYHYYQSLLGEYINLGRSEEQLLGQIGFPPEIELSPDDFVKAIHIIAAAADNDMTRLINLAGLSVSAFGRDYNIPLRTLQEWCAKRRNPPEYVVRLLGYALIGGFDNAAKA